MQRLTSFATLAFLIIPLSLATPVANPNMLFPSINDCASTTFNGETSGASPDIADCQQLVYNIRGDGSWALNMNSARDLASYGTCKFRAETGNFFGALVGNEDIRDLINDSIRDFGDGSKVGASGRVDCVERVGGLTGQYATVRWYIMHT